MCVYVGGGGGGGVCGMNVCVCGDEYVGGGGLMWWCVCTCVCVLEFI